MFDGSSVELSPHPSEFQSDRIDRHTLLSGWPCAQPVGTIWEENAVSDLIADDTQEPFSVFVDRSLGTAVDIFDGRGDHETAGLLAVSEPSYEELEKLVTKSK
jgi:hypothetical protein